MFSIMTEKDLAVLSQDATINRNADQSSEVTTRLRCEVAKPMRLIIAQRYKA